MPYADNHGVAIHYELEGEGPPLVLQHGLTQCTTDWYECGYVDRLSPDFRLVLVDARAHGASGKPHSPTAYTLESCVGDVVAVLNTLDITKAHFWGYSRGGWIGFGMARYAAGRLDRLVIGGQHPYARSMVGLRQAVQAGLAHGAETFVAEMGMGEFKSEYAMRLRSTDMKAFLALAQDRPSLEDILPGIAKVSPWVEAGQRKESRTGDFPVSPSLTTDA
jgi:pimeloyl-ACP methyl ester carboxylesterase